MHCEHFDNQPDQITLAPGRVNLIGEHTDYNDGFVLPAAIDFYTCVAASKTSNNQVTVCAIDFDSDIDQFDINDDITASDVDLWKNYIRGAFNILKADGHSISGCILTISGNIPKGAGLSSSASLEVAVLFTLNKLFSLGMSKTEIAILGQRIEGEFVGISCGVMDQLSAALGQDNHAILMDCRDYSVKPVSIPPSLSLLIINSNVRRQLVESGYNDRRKACEEAAEKLGIKMLRDISTKELLAQKEKLSPIVAQRAAHVTGENERVISMSAALEKGDVRLISILMKQSHMSMKNLFEITTSELDYLVELVEGVVGSDGGARMTGGGFGGCVVALIPHDRVAEVKREIADNYYNQTGLREEIYMCHQVAGVQSL
ncbi:UNVERIFIED_CONTAM: hypothetical protein GTU68_029034 [Idotea baltica]|nr:hypothetical protein [Idotea baltica]